MPVESHSHRRCRTVALRCIGAWIQDLCNEAAGGWFSLSPPCRCCCRGIKMAVLTLCGSSAVVARVFNRSAVLQAPLATNSDECKGRRIHSHKRNDDSHETSALINHRGTLGFCSLLLIDLPPVLPVLLCTVSYPSSIFYCPSNSFQPNLHCVARIKSATQVCIICFFLSAYPGLKLSYYTKAQWCT